jgi:hypothetical protein
MRRVVPTAHIAVEPKTQRTWSKKGDPEPDVAPDDDPERASDPLDDHDEER